MGVNDNQIKELIKDVCVQLGEKYAQPKALDIVYATGLVESKYQYIQQIGPFPVVGRVFESQPKRYHRRIDVSEDMRRLLQSCLTRPFSK